jgi:hypothetical protein
VSADKALTLTEAVKPAAEGEDHGLAEHVGAIEDAYQVALAQIAAVAESWTELAPDPAAVAGPATEELTAIAVMPPVPAEHVAA